MKCCRRFARARLHHVDGRGERLLTMSCACARRTHLTKILFFVHFGIFIHKLTFSASRPHSRPPHSPPLPIYHPSFHMSLRTSRSNHPVFVVEHVKIRAHVYAHTHTCPRHSRHCRLRQSKMTTSCASHPRISTTPPALLLIALPK